MATQALYRKWRSRTFEEVIGQGHVTQTLQNALANDRVAHAYLFAGPRGTGKTTTARLLAKAVNCVGETDHKPCGVCRICQAVDEGRMMDLIEIDAASNRGIDEIRDLRDKVGFRPGEARTKFYIIDEVHMLTDPAFNALLKTLEEPPPHVIFVLATTEPHRIPDTILSRCQRFDFRRIPLSGMVPWLAHIAQEEALAIEPSALEFIARQGAGSLRDAISLLDQLAAYGATTITLEQVQTMLGTVASQAIADLVDRLIDRNVPAGLGLINQTLAEGMEPRQFTREMVDYLRKLLLLKMGDGSQLLAAAASETELATMKQQAERMTPAQLMRTIRVFNSAAQEAKTGFLPQLPLELAFLESTTAAEETPPRAVETAQAQTSEAKTVYKPAAPTVTPGKPAVTPPEPAPRASAPAAPPPPPPAETTPAPEQNEPAEAVGEQPAAAHSLAFEHVEQSWRAILSAVRKTDPMVQGLMNSVELVDVERTTVIIEAPSDLLRGRINQPHTKALIEGCLTQVLGTKAHLRCVMHGEHVPSSRPAQPAVENSVAKEAPSDAQEYRTGEGAGDVAASPAASNETSEATHDDPMIDEGLKLGGIISDPDA